MLLIVFATKQKNATGTDGSASPDRFSNKDPLTLEPVPPLYWEVKDIPVREGFGSLLTTIASIQPGNDRFVANQNCQQTFGVMEVLHIEDAPEDTLESAQELFNNWVASGMPTNERTLLGG